MNAEDLEYNRRLKGDVNWTPPTYTCKLCGKRVEEEVDLLEPRYPSSGEQFGICETCWNREVGEGFYDKHPIYCFGIMFTFPAILTYIAIGEFLLPYLFPVFGKHFSCFAGIMIAAHIVMVISVLLVGTLIGIKQNKKMADILNLYYHGA